MKEFDALNVWSENRLVGKLWRDNASQTGTLLRPALYPSNLQHAMANARHCSASRRLFLDSAKEHCKAVQYKAHLIKSSPNYEGFLQRVLFCSRWSQLQQTPAIAVFNHPQGAVRALFHFADSPTHGVTLGFAG